MNQPLRVGIAGLGTVGASAVRLLESRSNGLVPRTGRALRITGLSARTRERDRGFDPAPYSWFDDATALASNPDIDIFVELIGGEDGPALDAVRAALKAGKHVVTANKALIAKHGLALGRLAAEHDVQIGFEAAVAGGIPVIKTLREALAGNEVDHVSGILNGTCNYILTRMQQDRIGFDECLAEAQRLGYAEADPTFDVQGYDTAHKLAILTSLAFGTEIDAESVYVEGITSITLADLDAADELGYKIKLLGVAQRTESGIEQRVHPTMIPKSAAIAQIDGVLNGVAIDGDAVGQVVLVGPGAGGDATASAVIADLADIARGLKIPAFGRPPETLAPYTRARMRRHEGGYYIRFSVVDRPGAFARIATCMADNDISLESIVQRKRAVRSAPAAETEPHAQQPVVLLTYETTEAAIRQALETIETAGVIASKPQIIRIEAARTA
ncbi:MAG: homoserine dehydrogenase [Pseudomonadota bacterium]